jgi:hypothetical protein
MAASTYSGIFSYAGNNPNRLGYPLRTTVGHPGLYMDDVRHIVQSDLAIDGQQVALVVVGLGDKNAVDWVAMNQ